MLTPNNALHSDCQKQPVSLGVECPLSTQSGRSVLYYSDIFSTTGSGHIFGWLRKTLFSQDVPDF